MPLSYTEFHAANTEMEAHLFDFDHTRGSLISLPFDIKVILQCISFKIDPHYCNCSFYINKKWQCHVVRHLASTFDDKEARIIVFLKIDNVWEYMEIKSPVNVKEALNAFNKLVITINKTRKNDD